MWDGRDGCMVLWAVISEAEEEYSILELGERPGSRSLFYLVPLIYYSSLQEPVRTGMDDVNGDRQNTKAREEW